MLGWWIIVSTQTPEEINSSTKESRQAAILAQWSAGIEGTHWIEQLVSHGKAAKLSAGGYPNRYTAKAADVLQLLRSGGIKPPARGPWIIGIDEGEEYVQPPGWMGKVEIHADRLSVCAAEQVLTIEAWDES